jgi:hypothetical protein
MTVAQLILAYPKLVQGRGRGRGRGRQRNGKAERKADREIGRWGF